MKKALLVLMFSLLSYTIPMSSAEVIIDNLNFQPCKEECTAWIYRTPEEKILYAPKAGPELLLANAPFHGGKYKVTVCGDGPNASSDSLYVGIGDDILLTLDLKFWILNRSRCSSQLQDGGDAIVDLLNKNYIIRLWAREDGLTVTDLKIERID
jgi:hypothetical protein